MSFFEAEKYLDGIPAASGYAAASCRALHPSHELRVAPPFVHLLAIGLHHFLIDFFLQTIGELVKLIIHGDLVSAISPFADCTDGGACRAVVPQSGTKAGKPLIQKFPYGSQGERKEMGYATLASCRRPVLLIGLGPPNTDASGRRNR